MAGHDAYVKQSLSKYKYADIAKRDVLNVFQQFKDLRPKMETYIFNDGMQKDLLSLDGTIPVNYKGSTYNIPVQIWILDTHPYNPPMSFVKPTNTMQIRQGRNVDANGKVDLPYLRDWRYPQSDLLGLMQILTIVFGEEPPVFSRVPPRPAYPPQGAAQGTPPYPTQGGYPMPTPGGGTGGTPPYPSYNPPGGYPRYGGSGGGYPQQQSYPSQGFGGYPSQAPVSNPPYPAPSYPYPGGSNPPYPASTSTTQSTTTPQMSGMNTVTEEHIKASLLSAVEDKMKRRLKEVFDQAQAEMDVLYKTQADLLKGKEKLQQMMDDLEKEKNDVEGNIRLLQSKDKDIKEALNKMEKEDDMDIDDAVVTTAPLYRQLLNAFAEEQAVEDALYYLGEGLRKNVIELDVFLKQVRELSRKQFMLRALIQKCREKAGLPALS